MNLFKKVLKGVIMDNIANLLKRKLMLNFHMFSEKRISYLAKGNETTCGYPKGNLIIITS